ncbi:MAG: DUF1592 domain-containing protein [Verrucomicrobiota bacterium]
MNRFSLLLVFLTSLEISLAMSDFERGKILYQKQCLECHGADGEGVADEYDEPLVGTRPFEKLQRYIDRAMPEQDSDLCVGEDARLVTQYIWEEFYSPEAQTRRTPPRFDLTRLTVEQYRASVADVVGRFRGNANRPFDDERGLKGEYVATNRYRPNAKRDAKRLDRVDPALQFDFGKGSPAATGFDSETFSIEWDGSIITEETGLYEIVLRTRNGVMMYFNQHHTGNKENDGVAFIDGWVNDGDAIKEHRVTVYLLGGRAYPLHIDFLKYKQDLASIQLLWKPPHGVLTPVPHRNLLPRVYPPVTVVSTPFPADDSSAGYVRGSLVSKEWHEAVTNAALEASGLVIDDINRLSGSDADDEDRQGKLKEFCRKFAVAALRRPMTEEQYQRIIDRQFSAGIPAEEATRRSILLALTSPQFLYPGLATEPHDHYSVAATLALALWDSIPDEALTNAAANGHLRTRNQVLGRARKMVEDPRAKAKMRGFFHHWLEMDAVDEIAKDRKKYPHFNDAIAADLRTSLELFIDEVIWKGNSDYRELLLSDKVWMNKRLAGLYGKESEGWGFKPVSFGPRKRSGVLTHPYLLSALSYHDNTSPIHRGVFLTRNIVGEKLNPPPDATTFDDGKFDPSLTMREKVTELTRSKACMACHQTINPLGFSLEHYDAIGRWRWKEKDKPIDATSNFETGEGQKIKLTGPRDVANYAAKNPFAHKTFIRQLFQHTVKYAPAAYGTDTLEELRKTFADSGFHVRNILAEISVLAAMHELKENTEGKTAANRTQNP